MTTKILVAIFGASDGTEMVRLAGALTGRGFAVNLHFFGIWEDLAPRIDQLLITDCSLSDVRGGTVLMEQQAASSIAAAPSSERDRSRVRILIGDFYYRLRARLLRGVYGIRALLTPEFFRFRREQLKTRQLLDLVEPDVLVLPLEAVGDRSATLASAARLRGIPVVVVPYTIPVNVAEVGERFYSDRRYWTSSPVNRISAWLAPQWVKEYRGRHILRLRPSEIAARWLAGLRYEYPWRGGGLKFTDAIAVESAAMEKFYLSEGYPAAKLHITGTVADDSLAGSFHKRHELRRALDRELDLDPGKPVLLCAMPPDFSDRPESEFRSYREVVRFWMSTLNAVKNFNLVVRLHPSLDARELSPLVPGNIRLALHDTANLIALSGLYVASVSSTIRWAIQCGVPVVNYDLYRFGYQDFAAVDGVVLVKTAQDFAAIMRKIDEDSAYLGVVRTAQQRASADWGALDGKSGDRIAALLTRFAAAADQTTSKDLTHHAE